MVSPQATDDEYRLLMRKFQRIGRKMIQGKDRDLKDLGLTSIQADALLFFDRFPNSQINGLRDHLDVTHQAACGLVDRMRSKGLIDVEVSDDDARARTINLSESGRVLCTELKSRGSTAGHAAFDRLTSDEIRVFSATLDRIEESIGR